MLDEAIKSQKKFTLEEITANNKRVAVPPTTPGSSEFAPCRTLWYAQYDLDRQTLIVKFHLGEKPDPENGNKVVLEYSSPKNYELKK